MYGGTAQSVDAQAAAVVDDVPRDSSIGDMGL